MVLSPKWQKPTKQTKKIIAKSTSEPHPSIMMKEEEGASHD
jgi:hypothetical protein